jgi:hypothetical protein
MPQYDFLCHSCQKLFSQTLTLPDYENTEIESDHVEHGRWIAFPRFTSTKSA